MTTAELVAELVRRGVVLEAHGDRLRYHPAARVTEAERAKLRERKAEVLVLLEKGDRIDRTSGSRTTLAAWRNMPAAERHRLEVDAAAGDPMAHLVLEAIACNPTAVAWRLYSRVLGRSLWVARDLMALLDLERDGLGGLPVVLADDLERLRSIDITGLNATLETLAAFPGARLADALPVVEEYLR